jgi:tRNA/rRNA methyltransferase
LLTQLQRDAIDVVLVSPRNPLNIGAAARAMANFGFSQLAVAAPYAPHWREARSAVGAPDLLLNATESVTLAAAISPCTLVIGTGTLTHRKPEQPVVSLPDLGPIVARELARGGRAALVFGPEKHGLTRDDLSYCHLLVEIPTDARQPSMNLGQAVAVCLYELTSRYFAPAIAEINDVAPTLNSEQLQNSDSSRPVVDVLPHSSAPSSLLDLLAKLIEQAMTAAGYSPNVMQAANRHDLRVMLRRLNLSTPDARRILGVFRRIVWRLKS